MNLSDAKRKWQQTRSSEWLRVVCVLALFAPTPSPAQNQNIPVGDLSDANAFKSLQQNYRIRCHKLLPVTNEQTASPLPNGTIVDQLPHPNQTMSCAEGVTITRSNGTPPAIANSWMMPALKDYVGLALFQQDVRKRCGENARAVATYNGQSDAPRGSIYYQEPHVGDPVTCATAVSAYFASGPPWLMPDLKLAGEEQRLQGEAQSRCSQPLTITRHYQEQVGLPAGTLLSQLPEKDTIVTCDTSLTVTLSRVPAAILNNVDPSSQTRTLNTVPASPWYMPDITHSIGRNKLGRETLTNCGRRSNIEPSRRPDPAPIGAIVGQIPVEGSLIDCNSRIAIVQSQGPDCSDDNRTFIDRLLRSSACHSAPIQPWMILLAVGLAGLGFALWKLRPHPNPLPPPTIVQGPVKSDCNVVTAALHGLIPDITVDLRSGEALVEPVGLLTIAHEEDEHV